MIEIYRDGVLVEQSSMLNGKIIGLNGGVGRATRKAIEFAISEGDREVVNPNGNTYTWILTVDEE